MSVPYRALCHRRLAALLVLVLAACDYMAFSFDGGTGLVVITISDDRPPSSGGYRIRTHQEGVPDRIVLVAPGEELQLEAASPDRIELTLLAPSDCHVVGPNPQVVRPRSESPVRATFVLECAGP